MLALLGTRKQGIRRFASTGAHDILERTPPSIVNRIKALRHSALAHVLVLVLGYEKARRRPSALEQAAPW
jgi:hypothetical protein